MSAGPACLTALRSAVLLCAGCGGYQPQQSADGGFVDRRLSRFSYIAEGVGATLVVGTQAARYREDTGYLPVEIAVANTSGDGLRLTRESFTLRDERGRQYRAATPAELIEGYGFLDMDRSALSELTSVAASTFSGYHPTPSKLSPTREIRSAGAFTEDAVRGVAVLPVFTYIVDFLYFPKPGTGIKGHRFELMLDAPALPEPVVVSFVVD